MSWAKTYIEILEEKGEVQFRPKGNSMAGKINSGQLCTVKVFPLEDLKVNDIVLCKVRGQFYLHLISAIKIVKGGAQFLIANNKGFINGWANKVYGKCIKIES